MHFLIIHFAFSVKDDPSVVRPLLFSEQNFGPFSSVIPRFKG